MEALNDEDRAKIKRILQRNNRYIWRDEIVEKVLENINKLRSGELQLTDWFVPDIMNYQDYLYQLALHKFVLPP